MITVDTKRYEVKAKGRVIPLSPKEFGLLKVLKEADGHVLSREQLLEKVWRRGPDVFEIDTRTVDQHVARLRRKLRVYVKENIIRTVTTVGYSYIGK